MRSREQQLDPTERRIINANRGVSNVVSMRTEVPHILDLLDRFEKLLLNHCGPTSGYAMSVNAQSLGIQFEPNVFTRDGISILSAVECMAPIENYIKDLLCYLGGRVDSAAKDGTTSSMLFGIAFLKYVLNNPDTESTTTYLRSKIVQQFFDSILEEWKSQYTWTIDECITGAKTEEAYMRAASIIAFMQALSSSGGDIELANAMREIYAKSPRISWDFIDYYQSAAENTARFTVEVDEFDSRIKCVAAMSGSLNASLGTEYVAENVKCFVFTDSFTDYDPRVDSLLFYLKDIDINAPVLLLLPYVPSKILSTVMSLNTNRSAESKITLWQYSAEERLAGQALNWELMIPNAVAGITPYTHPTISPDTPCSDDYCFIAKKVIWKNTYLEFYGTIDAPEGSVLHPYYSHPETATPFYTEVLTELLEQKKKLEDNRVKNVQLVTIFTEMLNRIACLHRPKLRLGGPAHEQVASIPIVQDVQGAIMSSLRHGFSINGMAPLMALLSFLDVDKETGYKKYVYQVFRTVGREMLNYLYGYQLSEFTDPWYLKETLRIGKSEYKNMLMNSAGNFKQYMELLQDLTPSQWKNNEFIRTNYPVLQPVRITEELFKRVQELLMKFSNTTEIIVTGGMLLSEAAANNTSGKE